MLATKPQDDKYFLSCRILSCLIVDPFPALGYQEIPLAHCSTTTVKLEFTRKARNCPNMRFQDWNVGFHPQSFPESLRHSHAVRGQLSSQLRNWNIFEKAELLFFLFDRQVLLK